MFPLLCFYRIMLGCSLYVTLRTNVEELVNPKENMKHYCTLHIAEVVSFICHGDGSKYFIFISPLPKLENFRAIIAHLPPCC